MSRTRTVSLLAVVAMVSACQSSAVSHDALAELDAVEAATLDGATTSAPRCDSASNAVGTWRRLSPVGAPAPGESLIWTGTEMLVVDWSTAPRIDAYDPVADRWRSVGIGSGAPEPRYYPFVGWSGGKLVLFGGYATSPMHPRQDGAVLDLASETWTAIPPDTVPDLVPNSHGTVGLANGSSLLFLSRVGSVMHPVAAVFDVSTGAFTHVEPAPISAYDGCDAPATDGTHVACSDVGSEYVHTIAPYAFDPLPDVPATTILDVWHAGWLDGVLWVWGGTIDLANDPTYFAVPFDATARSWGFGVPSPIARMDATVGVLRGRLLIWGGIGYAPDNPYGAAPRSDGAIFDPSTRTWAPMPCIPLDGDAQTANVGAVSTGDEWILYARGVAAAYRP